MPGCVLVDTNVILTCHKMGHWSSLSKAYSLETVEQCIVETQTGFQRRRPEQQINEQELRESLARVHQVTDVEMAEVFLRGGNALDQGERALWAHALGRTDKTWILCGPDRASMRFGYDCGMRAKLKSLGELSSSANLGFDSALPQHFQKKWLENLMSNFVLGLL